MSGSAAPELGTLRIEIDGEIGTLTLDRPDAFNAMSQEMIGEMAIAFSGSPTGRRSGR